MSLATTGGGGFAGGAGGAGAGGITLAHQANSVGIPPSQPIPPQNTATGAEGTTTGIPPPLLGSDTIDKSFGLSLKNVRNVAHLPIVAIDLFGSSSSSSSSSNTDSSHSNAHVAYFPKKPADTIKGLPPITVGTISTNIQFQSSSSQQQQQSSNSGDVAQKTLRKYLTKSKSYMDLRNDSLIIASSSTTTKSSSQNNTSKNVTISKPHRWLGVRRIKDVPESIRTGTTDTMFDEVDGVVGSSKDIITEETLQGIGCCLSNSTLDGSSVPNNDDFDRVLYKVRLSETKKVTTILPEEAVEMIFQEAKYIVATSIRKNSSTNNGKNNNKEDTTPGDSDILDEMDDFPCAVALPSWACYDACIDAMMDVMNNGSSNSTNNGIIVQRNVAALVGAVLPSLDGNVTPLLQRLHMVHVALQKEHQIRVSKEPNVRFDDEITIFVFSMIANDGIELTAIQISSINMDNVSCIFGSYKVLCNVSVQHNDPISQMGHLTKQLEDTLDIVASEADGPAAIIVTGTNKEQKLLTSTWDKIKIDDWAKVPVYTTNEDCIAKGIAVLGGVAHGRLSSVLESSSRKPKMGLGIRVQNIVPVAVGIQMNYHYNNNTKSTSSSSNQWTPVKVIFDFDRQIPAGPHIIELNAAECAVYRQGKIIMDNNDDEEVLMKAIKANEGSKGIPIREDAALHFSVRIVQKLTRNSNNWIPVGDPMEPLVQHNEQKDGTVTRIGCERIVWELSIGITGMITTAFVGERESVVVATKSARNSTIRYYLGVIFAVLFFGGFLFKSYWDEYVLNRDTARLLAYYKHVVPGSYQDGDLHNARYTCYKYRYKKAKLWRNLEKKYGIPVLTVKEYEIMDKENVDNGNKQDENEGETVDLDDVDEKEEPDL